MGAEHAYMFPSFNKCLENEIAFKCWSYCYDPFYVMVDNRIKEKINYFHSPITKLN